MDDADARLYPARIAALSPRDRRVAQVFFNEPLRFWT